MIVEIDVKLFKYRNIFGPGPSSANGDGREREKTNTMRRTIYVQTPDVGEKAK